MTYLLSLEDIHISNGIENRLQNINLSINVGEKIAILGKSGAGKTTLIKVSNGSLHPNSGRIKLKCLGETNRP